MGEAAFEFVEKSHGIKLIAEGLNAQAPLALGKSTASIYETAMQRLLKPLLIYDGECRFCKWWIERWRLLTSDRVDYATAQRAASNHPQIPAKEFSQAVIWVDSDGSWCAGAEAVFRALAASTRRGKLQLYLYQRVPIFAWVADAIYHFIAHHRIAFSFFTRLLWGQDVRPPTYGVSSWIFLRLLGMIYLIAFGSYWIQLEGLIGEHGILPARDFFHYAGEVLGSGRFWQLPSVCWWGASNAALKGWCLAGLVAAGLLMVGVASIPCLFFLWLDYLSLTVAGQIFYQFQWDILLLEAGFLSIFLAPISLGRARFENPPRLAHFLLIWLLFRLMLASGLVKLTSGDTAWMDGTALNFHYYTQPLPTPLAWYAQQFPEWFQKLSVRGMFFMEMVLPFLLFCPRRLRLLAVIGLAILQVNIALTGNYGFFNFLSLALCLLAVDDVVWKKCGLQSTECGKARFMPQWVILPAAVAIFLISLVPFASALRQPMPFLEPLGWVYIKIAPFRTINSYGLFAVMTKERREIIVQGSDNGVTWKTCEFLYKPGDPRRAPPWVAPYMPRLDWQMWFAALGSVEENPWFINFLQRLLEGAPPVWDLLAENPFPHGQPQFMRAMSDDYRFTTSDERKKTGNWWETQPVGIYCPEVSLRRR